MVTAQRLLRRLSVTDKIAPLIADADGTPEPTAIDETLAPTAPWIDLRAANTPLPEAAISFIDETVGGIPTTAADISGYYGFYYVPTGTYTVEE